MKVSGVSEKDERKTKGNGISFNGFSFFKKLLVMSGKELNMFSFDVEIGECHFVAGNKLHLAITYSFFFVKASMAARSQRIRA